MKRRIKFYSIGILILLIAGVIAFQMSSSSFNGRDKLDFGGAKTNASSASFVQRFIFGNQPVSGYVSPIYSGRFGILDDRSIIAITINSPLINSEIARGGNVISNEDTENLVSDFVQILARVYSIDTYEGVPSTLVYFYFNDTLVGNNLTNSSGDAIIGYDKTTYPAGIYNLSVNYSNEDYDLTTNNSISNFSLMVFNIPSTQGNRGVATQYVWNQTAIFYFNITKTNSSGTFFYDSQNITANATDSNDKHYPETVYVSGYRLYKNAQGQYESRVFLNQTLLSTYTSVIKWKIYISDDNYTNYLATARHSDIDVVAGPICGNSLIETGEGCDDGNLVAGDGCSAVCAVEGGGGGGGGGGGDTCTNECTSGATGTTCVTGLTLKTKTCGNYDSDVCTEWGGESYSDCGAGQVCENSQCVQSICTGSSTDSCTTLDNCLGTKTRNCVNGEWGEFGVCVKNDLTCGGACANGASQFCTTTDNCAGTRICSNNIWGACVKIDSNCGECTENWDCQWTTCFVGEQYSYPFNCVDSNNCGTTKDKPVNPLICGTEPQEEISECSPQWSCSEWGECNAKYSFGDIFAGMVFAEGKSERVCYDLSFCETNKTESKPCGLTIPVYAKKALWCGELYIEIFNFETRKLVGRIKETEIAAFFNLKRVDISFFTSDFMGYCDYCFDGIKNRDETELDCGGPSCPKCVAKISFFDWVFWVVLISWIIFMFLIIFFWKRRKDEEEKYRKRSFAEKFKDWFKSIIPDRREDKIKERKIEIWFRKLFGRKEESKRESRIKNWFRKISERRRAKKEFARVEYVERNRRISSLKKEMRRRKIANLMKKLQIWKKEGYYGTAEIEAEIERLENQRD